MKRRNGRIANQTRASADATMRSIDAQLAALPPTQQNAYPIFGIAQMANTAYAMLEAEWESDGPMDLAHIMDCSRVITDADQALACSLRMLHVLVNRLGCDPKLLGQGGPTPS